MSRGLGYSLLAVVLLAASVAAKDSKPPTVTITTPTTSTTYVATGTQVTVRGTAKDHPQGGGQVARVEWQTDRGQQGLATGTTAWQFVLPLNAGVTRLTVTAVDTSNHTGQDTLTITAMTPPPPPPPPGPITVEWTYGGTQGDLFQLERCTLQEPPCTMVPVAALALTDRRWVDTGVQPDEDYCYRLAVITGSALGPYSNTRCSP